MTTNVMERPAGVREAYGGGEQMPLGGYAGLMALFAGGVGLVAALTALLGRRLPERMHAGDVALLAVATHKLSRLVTMDFVTSPLRAPFTEFVKSAGTGEVVEQSRGRGLQRATGDLLTCPWCFDWWVAAGMGLAYLVAPRATRFVAALLTAVTAADFLQLAYEQAKAASGQAAE
jgi:hypothetical protein